jgi:hypothetical protein
MIAHIAGFPVEELLPLAFASGGSAWLLTARWWLVRRRRRRVIPRRLPDM